jgi:hypothetical protein
MRNFADTNELPLKGEIMGIEDSGSTSARTPVAGRAALRVLGAVLVMSTALWFGALSSSSTPASAATVAAWSGTGAVLPSNADPGNEAALITTSCPASGNCVTAGSYFSGGHFEGLIDTQSDGSWTATEAPLPPGAAANPEVELLSLHCPSVGSCAAVGFYRDTSGHDQGLLLTQTGGSWSATEAPLPPGAGSNPNVAVFSVSCAVPGTCVAVGDYSDGGGHTQGLLLTRTGGAWSAAKAPLPPGAAAIPATELLATSCGAPGSCAAVGEYHGGGTAQGLILTFAGNAWSAAKAPLPADASPTANAILINVSCADAGSCTAVGQYSGALSATHSVIESISNGIPTATEAPVPSDAKTSGSSPAPTQFLAGLSCPTAQYCVATGTYVTKTGSGAVPLIETLSGGTWAATEGPGSLNPAAASILLSVSCSWPGSCAAIGSSQSASSTSGFIETLTNATWSETPVILPANAKVPNQVHIGLEEGIGHAISCVAGTCATSGSYSKAATEGGFINTFPNLDGYQLVASDGGLFAFNTPFFGSMGGQPLNQPVVGMAVVPDSGGYYEVASDGGLFAFNAPFYGSMGGKPLNKPIVGIAFDTRTGGYYEVASDGGIFAFNAPFYGSMGGQTLNKPIVGIAFDAQTGGYYEVASDGGIFAFNAPFLGSTGNLTLNKPVVGMTVDTTTGGYYEVASDGGIFAYGAPFLGSTGNLTLNQPVVGMAYDFLTGGYYEVASDGGIFAYGAPFSGSTGNLTLNQPVVGMAFG